ncbi:zinc finger FYVE domain-containing protein 1-like isoform X2 [Rhinatrema bivittatum]|uniref:zinc finger FYVE domain-containing protein 1-like isoform X2 n=1 Tax=Rhinatrema bivittatum TaxID=194408 RepID=UPI001128C4E1|nr:zinc finger FYVE domain-containing protein 1-like isoform X2 [Rhinatrema bivittatum]
MSALLLGEREPQSPGKAQLEEGGGSFLLVDENENLQVEEDEFLKRLGCRDPCPVKVLSIFGNTGDGKSHTLNQAFFGGREVFRTSPSQTSCTVGVWAAYDPALSLLLLDTEGLLGATERQNQRARLLLKVLAVSDLVVYRTRAERLHNDMFQFLGSASSAYLKFFTGELKTLASRCGLEVPLSSLGPAVIVFHETTRTSLLGNGSGTSGAAETQLQKRFHELHLSTEAFSSVRYVGVQTVVPPSDFLGLQTVIKQQARDTSTRSPRPPGIVYRALKALSDRFSGEIPEEVGLVSFFPDEYFTCPSTCLSCGVRCKNGMNHLKDGLPHQADGLCHFTHQYNNRVLICKRCYERGREVIVIPKTVASSDNPWLGLAKYAWSGFVLECHVCGIIYRSRQYWYGNQDPEGAAVRQEVRHIWPGNGALCADHHNAARRVLDGMSVVMESMTEYSAQPIRTATAWLMDQVAPDYWRPNHEITACFGCKKPFDPEERKHHCRACGEGFCHGCSNQVMPVPERGWGARSVRVCKACYRAGRVQQLSEVALPREEEPGFLARRLTEVVQGTLDAVSSAIDYPLDFVKDTARPSYWVSDTEVTHCQQCKRTFTPKVSKHHCRACGQGICNSCSQQRRPVPSRGWHHPVRVCDDCSRKRDDL